MLLQRKNQERNSDENLANKSSARKVLEPLGQILTDYRDNKLEMDTNIDVLFLNFYWISPGTIYLHS